MTLAAPLMLIGLLALPLIWWLLRAVPPAPRIQSFPAIRLLANLQARRQEAERAPLWLLLLRLLAGLLLVLGLAQPVLRRAGLPMTSASSDLLIILDDGWSSASDWSQRLALIDTLLDRAARDQRKVRLFTTAADETGILRPPGPALDPASLRPVVDARRPRAWPIDRKQAASLLAIAANRPSGEAIYISDGLATGADRAWRTIIAGLTPLHEWRGDPAGLRVLTAPASQPDGLTQPVAVLPQPIARRFSLRAEDGDGATLAKLDGVIPARAAEGSVKLELPVELRNRIARLSLEGTTGPAGIRLLDEGDRRRPVGLIDPGSFADAPLLGPLFYLRRALQTDTELRVGDVPNLLSRQLSVLVATDGTLTDPDTRKKVADWVRGGGMLIRFAGPSMQTGETADPEDASPDTDAADQPAPTDALLPEALLDGARNLGGAMSWSHPEPLAPFAADSPFAGLAIPADVAISRQVLARPAIDLDQKSWARLADGTPLVTHAPLGAGQLVLFHVTSTADWSNLPFSGLFVQMLHRLVARAAGLSVPGGDTVLAPFSLLDGDGVFGAPPPSARGLASRAFGATPASAAHPPGLYGPPSDRRALNLGDGLPTLAAADPFGPPSNLTAASSDRAFGPWLLAAGLLLLCLDLLASLHLRGLLRRRLSTASVLLGAILLATPMRAADPPPGAALQTRLGYVVTGDAQTDTVSREGLEGLSNYVNDRTSAVLGHPDGVHPGTDDLSFYPLLYWPIGAGAVADPAAITALNLYMSRGGMLLLDTRGSDTARGGNFSGTEAPSPRALRRATQGLDIPPLVAVDSSHVLSHSFYLLHSFPGRYVGAPVWVAAGGQSANGDEGGGGGENVSPVIIGANDWASAWAIDQDGNTPYAVIPDGESQRTLAYRFGVNAVIYALTGNYKSDQVHVPALLQRLGE